jgi:hypothetical protein
MRNNSVIAGVLVLTKYNQALLPVVAPTKPQSLTHTSKMIVNFGNKANKIHPVNIDSAKDIVKHILGIMSKENDKSCKFEYDNINLRNSLKVTLADGSEKPGLSPNSLRKKMTKMTKMIPMSVRHQTASPTKTNLLQSDGPSSRRVENLPELHIFEQKWSCGLAAI